MTAMVAEDLAQIPMSPYLAASLERAAQYAEAQAHREVSLEHVLLALAEDPEASVILRSSHVDIERLQTDVSNHLGNINERQDTDNLQPVKTSSDLQRILEAAAEAAKQGQRREINGAILLAAIIGDGGSTAAHILRAQGLTFEATIAALRTTVQQNTPPAGSPQLEAAPPPQLRAPSGSATTDDVLAEARARVGQRQSPSSSRPAALPGPVSPPVEPQWEQATPDTSSPADVEEHVADGSEKLRAPETVTSKDSATESSEPAPAPAQSPASGQPAPNPATPGTAKSDATRWAPPQPVDNLERVPAPQSRRVPPPLPPDAGLRPPGPQPDSARASGQSARQPAPGTQDSAAASQTQSLEGNGQRPPHIPPWVGGRDYTGARAPGPTSSNRQHAHPNAPPQRPRSTQVKVETGQLVHNIQPKMKAGVAKLIEVRIARANVKALATGLQGGGAAYKQDAMITKAMSVKLRAPDGGFWVEAASPETQWIDNVLGVMTDDYASWRWTVTPKTSGRKKLQLVVSARTVGTDGLAAETALPDQLFNVRVTVNYGQRSRRVAGWLAAAVFGGVLARFGESAFEAARGLIEKI